jgi:hypothetical protein
MNRQNHINSDSHAGPVGRCQHQYPLVGRRTNVRNEELVKFGGPSAGYLQKVESVQCREGPKAVYVGVTGGVQVQACHPAHKVAS